MSVESYTYPQSFSPETPYSSQLRNLTPVAPDTIVPNLFDTIPSQADDYDVVNLEEIKGKFQVAGAVVPYTVTTSKRCAPLGEAPAHLVVPGIYGTEGAYKPFARALAKLGSTAITFDPPRHQGIYSLAPANLCHPERLLPEVVTALARTAQSAYGIDAFHGIGHSMGGPGVFKAAEKLAARKAAEKAGDIIPRYQPSPEMLSVTMLDSAGLSGHHFIPLSLKGPRLLPEIVRAVKDNPNLCVPTILYGVTNGVRTFGEAVSVSECKISHERIAGLREQDVTTIGIFHEKDPFFPAEKAYKNKGRYLDYFEFGGPEQAGHLAPQLYPREVAEEYLTTLAVAGFQVADNKLAAVR